MKKNFGLPRGKVSPADAGELARFRQAVREKVVAPIEKRDAAQKAAAARARARTVR